MPRTILKSRLLSNKHRPKIKQESNKTQSKLPPHLQPFQQKLLSGNGFVEYKYFKFISSSISLLHHHLKCFINWFF